MKVTMNIDTEIGKRLRQARLSKGLTQQGLAEKIGISFQQVQKYENGINRVSSSRLLVIANVLNIPITYFFDDLGTIEPKDVVLDDSLTDSVMRVARLLNGIPDGDVKDSVFALIKTITRAEEG